MPKLSPKPWNDPVNRAAERDPAYRDHCYGTRAARDASWRRCGKAYRKLARACRPAGRIERAIFRAFLARARLSRGHLPSANFPF